MAKDYKGEEILVIPRTLLNDLGTFQGCNTNVDHYLETIHDPAHNFFMDRGAAEEDPSHKQLIPYCLFHHNGTYLHYTRGKSGGESRLHAAGSVGVGGHINPIDQRSLAEETYLAGVTREIEEELTINGTYTHKPVALLNDDSNPVGEVHLGIIHLVELSIDSPTDVQSAEDALANLSFQPLSELESGTPLHEKLETWSQHTINNIANF